MHHAADWGQLNVLGMCAPSKRHMKYVLLKVLVSTSKYTLNLQYFVVQQVLYWHVGAGGYGVHELGASDECGVFNT